MTAGSRPWLAPLRLAGYTVAVIAIVSVAFFVRPQLALSGYFAVCGVVGCRRNVDLERAVGRMVQSDPALLARLNLQAAMPPEQLERLAALPFTTVLAGSAGVIYEFSDYRCGFCRSMHARLPELATRAPGVQLRVIHYPVLSAESTELARIVLAVGSVDAGAATRLHGLLMERKLPDTAERLDATLRAVDQDPARIRALAASPAIESQLSSGLAFGQALGISGTPTFIIGNKAYPGSRPVAELLRLLEAA